MPRKKPARWADGRNLDVLNLWRGNVAYYPLWMGAGPTAYDLSPYRNDGTLTGMDPPTDWVNDTEVGMALDFFGNDYISIPDKSILDLDGGLSIAALVNLASNPGALTDLIVGKTNTGSSAGGGWGLVQAGTNEGQNQIALFLFDGAAPSPSFITTAAITPSEWVHIVATWDGTMAAGSIHIYFNGIDQAGTERNYGTMLLNNALVVNIMGSTGGTIQNTGRVAELGIWTRPISAGEVAFPAANPFIMIRQPDFSPFWDVAAPVGGIVRQVTQSYMRING